LLLTLNDELYLAILQVVSEVPEGRVVTYGQVARLAGYPRHARFVSKAMRAADESVNWHRVLNSQGKSSMDADMAKQQFDLLAEEGVESVLEKVDLSRYQWDPVLDGMMEEWVKGE
jgi:methylated-DNA-protein-cysteine methyltransferase-like protein